MNETVNIINVNIAELKNENGKLKLNISKSDLPELRMTLNNKNNEIKIISEK